MIAWWMVYAALVGVPVAAATGLMARVLRRHNRNERGVWVAGLALSIALPVGLLAWRLWAARSGAPVSAFVMELPGLDVAPSPEAAGPAISIGTIVLLGWSAASLAMAGWLMVSLAAVQRIRRYGARSTVLGRAVRLSVGAGPAVVGFLRPEILVPKWLLDVEGGDAEWILRHEEEHVRARDPLLLLGAHLIRITLPWNPVIWFLTSRLVRAIELDCDRRVLRSHPDPVAYGHTLVRALARRPAPLRAAAAFSLHSYDLEERIATMTTTRRRFGPLGWTSAVGALLLVASACGIPFPTNADDDVEDPTAPAAQTAASEAPRFTPYTVAPDLINRDEVVEALQDAYPDDLREAGIGGTARVWFFIGSDGTLRQRRLERSSGHPRLDDAAMEVARTMRFNPALNRDEPVDVWVAFPITFQPAPGDAPQANAERRSSPVPDGRLEDRPVFTPYTDAPEIQNRTEIQAALEAEYPPLLRDAGIGGTARVWFLIGSDGETREVRLDASSGHQAIDEAALSVARQIRFSPGRNGDDPVDVWVAMPITFQTR